MARSSALLAMAAPLRLAGRVRPQSTVPRGCRKIFSFFSYDGYSVPDRTGAAQYYHPINVVAPPPIPRFFSRLIDDCDYYMPV